MEMQTNHYMSKRKAASNRLAASGTEWLRLTVFRKFEHLASIGISQVQYLQVQALGFNPDGK
jgi:hypothetical protein